MILGRRKDKGRTDIQNTGGQEGPELQDAVGWRSTGRAGTER
jgi:hypothetical protein